MAGIQIGANFSYKAQLPLDERLVVADLTALKAKPSYENYDGLCKERIKILYIFK